MAEGEGSGSWTTWPRVAGLVYVLLIGVGAIGNGFEWVSGGADGAEAIFVFATNPIVGVILGTLATALVQSSSTVTSVIVGLVAGGLPIGVAIPMVMGANMGTTITNTIVSLGNVGNDDAFNRSFQAATVHDFFNLYSIILFLPIEILFHPLETMAGAIAGMFVDTSASMTDLNVVGMATKPVVAGMKSALGSLPDALGGALMIAIGIALVLASVVFLGGLLREAMTGKAKVALDAALGRSSLVCILAGAAITVLVQSSTTATSLLVPLAGAGTLTLRQIYPFTLGANMGTCITALLAATAVAGGNQLFALQIALVHLLYNSFGVLLFTTVPVVRDLPLRSAQWLGDVSEKRRAFAFGYILGMFFLLPGSVLGGQQLLARRDTEVLEAMKHQQALEQAERSVKESEMVIE